MLSDSQALYRRLYREASFGIVITDLNGEIVDANPRALAFLGFDRAMLVGMPIDAVYRTGQERMSPEELRAAGSGEELEVSATARTVRGASRPVRLFARRMRLDAQDYIVWSTQDATAQVEQDDNRRDLAAMIYHDMRNPLNTINASLSRLGKLVQQGDQPAAVTLTDLALRGTHQLTRLVNGLLDVERLQAGDTTLNRREARLDDLLREAAALMAVQAEEAEQELVVDGDGLPTAIAVDPDMILRVLLNLIENAIKYTPQPGTITVRASQGAEGVCVEVSDSGPGIPEEMRARVFDRYVRLKDRTAWGVGLGLAFCRAAVEAHGGRIWAENRLPRGATIAFVLPMVPLATSG
jgi:PAS domain S-box-containing protein